MFLSFLLASFGIIPAPAKITEAQGCFECPSTTIEYTISAQKDIDEAPLVTILETFDKPSFKKVEKSNVKVFIGSKYALGRIPYGAKTDEGYTLEVTPKGITVKAGTTTGAFYAAQTLRQLYELNGNIPCCKIEDAPYFGYRSLMFDVSRHFLSVEYIKKQLDAMAYLKLNRFHFHLTDSQSFRILLDSHPEMAKKTGFRKTVALRNGYGFVEEPEGYIPGTVYCAPGVYGGYYSKENLKDLISYAAARGIEMIPEIEMPGHNGETLFVHPELFCNINPLISTIDLCFGKEETFKFMEDILAEVMELFPSDMIHIGGDEAKKTNWKVCPDCARRMKEEGLASVNELQSYIIKRIERFVRSKGKRIVGWDEILQGGVSQTACLMLWRGASTKDVEEARKAGNDMIDCVSTHNYLCMGQDALYREPFAQSSMITTEKLYNEKPEAIEHMLGVEACLWSEWVASEKHHEYMLYPRAYALAEKGWTPLELRNDYQDFRSRSLGINKILKSKGYCTFDLENERQTTAANYEKIEHLALGAKVSYQGGEPADQRLTDGVPANFSGGWSTFEKDVNLIVDLGKPCDIHFIGTSFITRWYLAFPEKLEVFVSEDGKEYRSLGCKDLQITDRGFTMEETQTLDFDPLGTPNSRLYRQGTISWASYPVNFICNLKNVRYVKYSISHDNSLGINYTVDELIIN